MGDVHEAIAAYKVALRYSPRDVGIRLDLADIHLFRFAVPEAAQWYTEALNLDPSSVAAKAGSLCCRCLLEQDRATFDQLFAIADGPPGDGHARELVNCLVSRRPYQDMLPEPAEASINMMRSLLQEPERQDWTCGQLLITVSHLEAPSVRLALVLHVGLRRPSLRVRILPTALPSPDPRRPFRPVKYQLWRYEENWPHMVYPAPAPLVATKVSYIAGQPFRLVEWQARAQQTAAEFGPAALDDLLATMTLPPLPKQEIDGWNWVRHVQVAAAMMGVA
jgi:tetratricopeptide (TPR) repeat protein